MEQTRDRAYGLALVTGAAIVWSTAGLFVRTLNLDLWTMLAWRSLFASLSLILLVIAQNGRQSRQAFASIGWPGLAAVPVSAISMVSFVAALKFTTVANVMIVYATVPFVAAGMAFVWLGERASRRVLLASAIALAGILVMAGAATRPEDIAGNSLAFLMTLTFGVLLVMARRYPSMNMAPINAAAAALSAAVCWPFMAAAIPSLDEMLILALFGFTTTALAYLLFLTGGRYIPSSEAGLVGLLDVVLSPLWVWMAFAEQPGFATLIGGGIVVAAVAWYLLGHLRRITPARAP
jgi:drug/metabolite transporter (DMT)-like permease